MKTLPIVKKTMIASLFLAGFAIATSCDGCSRTNKTETTTYTEGTISDSVSTASGTTDSTTSTTSTTPADRRSPGGNGNSVGGKAANNGNALTEEEITDRIENSSSQPKDANGKPINSGGTSGSGMGTGTGSTGNNSKVTRPEDQKN